MTAIVWLRRDFRLHDNPALDAAVNNHDKVLLVYIHAPEEQAPWQPGAASNWWLHHSLLAFEKSLNGKPLLISLGSTANNLKKLCTALNVQAVYFNKLFEPALIEQEQAVATALDKMGVASKGFNSSFLCSPSLVAPSTQQGYKVFTPYWREAQRSIVLQKPSHTTHWVSPVCSVPSLSVHDLNLIPSHSWAQKFHPYWVPGEQGALDDLDMFVESHAIDYPTNRDIPFLTGTSLLSAPLHFGEITPNQIFWRLNNEMGNKNLPGSVVDVYKRQLGWREFATHVLVHNPQTPNQPLNGRYKKFPWVNDTQRLQKWQQGHTGFPLVDAGMRQLWEMGWMHNRVRLVSSGVLCKQLGINWLSGAQWFWDTLVDADLANNTLGWQWSAGCGADAAPYFRILNPVLQAERFAPKGLYVKKWLPELASLQGKEIFSPPQSVYFPPIVDLKTARLQALRRKRR